MANIFAIHSVGDSIVKYLRDTYPEPLRNDFSCEFRLLSSGELDEATSITTAVTLYLYRTAIDEHVRNVPDRNKPGATPYPLSLCLYYLVSIWADNALAEHTITAWVMSQLHQNPILDKSNLSSTADWDDNDQIQIVPIDLSNEDMMRLWDALSPSYRLSLPYLVRVVRIDSEAFASDLPVIATRYSYNPTSSAHPGANDD